MKHLLTAIALTMVAAAPAFADGPRPSSENNWPGMSAAQVVAPQLPAPQPAAAPVAVQAAQYAPYGHYVSGGKWRQDVQPVR